MKKVTVIVLLGACIVSASFAACDDDDDLAIPTGDAGGNGDTSSSSSSSSSSGGPADAAATGCAAYAEAACGRIARCSPLLLDIGFGTLDACKEGYTIICNRSTRAPGAGPLPQACIDALASGCGDVDPALATACASSKGTLTDGTACEFDGQCTSGRCGSAGGTPGCGLCKVASGNASDTPEGGSCTNEGRCERGLSCIGASTGTAGDPIPGTCQKMRALGEACTEAEDCNTGSHGDFGWMSFTVACLDGGCAKPLDEGASCRSPLQLDHSCDVQKKLRCELVTNEAGVSGRCNPWLFAKTNEPCRTNNTTPSGSCFGDNRCVSGDGGKDGTCVPKEPAGSPCIKDYDCRFGLECVNNTCTLLPADHCK